MTLAKKLLSEASDEVEAMNIAVTLPKTTDFHGKYQEELRAAEGGALLKFKVPVYPNRAPVGSRCYLYWKGRCVGWHQIVAYKGEEFICSTTGRAWRGKFICRSGRLHTPPPEASPMPPFRGFRYVDF